MKYVLNPIAIGQQGLKLSEFLVLLCIRQGVNPKDVLNSLLSSNKIVIEDGKYLVHSGWANKMDLALLNADVEIPKEQDLDELVKKLIDLFPTGKKEGTNQYYRGSKKDIATKLRKFFKIYGNYSHEDVYNATKRYVDSFNGDYRYMRILKYFIFKSVRKTNEDGVLYIEDVSQLAEYLENNDDTENANSTEWNNELIN